MLRRSMALFGLAAMLIAPGSAAAAPVFTETIVLRGYTSTAVSFEPCLPGGGGLGVVTTTFDGVFHITDHGDWFSVTETQVGTFTLDPLDPTLPSYEGSYRIHIADMVVLPDHMLTFNFIGNLNGDDGSLIRSRFVSHIRIVDGEVVMDFAHLGCR